MGATDWAKQRWTRSHGLLAKAGTPEALPIASRWAANVALSVQQRLEESLYYWVKETKEKDQVRRLWYACCHPWARAACRTDEAWVTESHRRGLLTQFPTMWVHQGNIFRGNQINLNPIFNALRTGLSMIKMFSIHWDGDSQSSVPSRDSLLPFTLPNTHTNHPHPLPTTPLQLQYPECWPLRWPALGAVLELLVMFLKGRRCSYQQRGGERLSQGHSA